MKLLIVFALALSTASASAFRMANSKLGITNGKTATVGQFAYQVGLSLELGGWRSAWCGGSLIGNEWVLTAAHCTYGIQSVTVYLGATERTKPKIKYSVSNRYILIHHGWNTNILKDNISLIRIPPTPYNTKTQPVILPAISSSYSRYTHSKVIASGWGLVSDSANSLTNDLQWAHMKIITNNACARTYGIIITSTKLCTSTPGGVSTCQGDSGGPLVLADSKVQVGLTSFGHRYGCARGFPVAFTRVTSYLKWIKQYTGISY